MNVYIHVVPEARLPQIYDLVGKRSYPGSSMTKKALDPRSPAFAGAGCSFALASKMLAQLMSGMTEREDLFMASTPIYMDYNATAPIRPEVIALTSRVMGEVGNASSVHSFGRATRKYLEDARAQVASLANVRPTQVIFTSGATESNNTALCGFEDKRVLISATEHPSVLETASAAEKIPVTSDGVVDMGALAKMLEGGADLVSVMLVNSETGVIQPLADIATLAKKAGAIMHSDAVQAAGRIALDFDALGLDLMSLSAHKMGGPQGVGALIFREGLQLSKFMCGGGQERRQRAGTENVAGIAGFGLAAEMAVKELDAYQKRIGSYLKKLEDGVRQISNEVVIYGAGAPRVANTSDIGLPGVPAETQLMALDLAGVAVSSGSACSSGAFKSSHVLEAMGIQEEEAKCALRISLGWATTEPDIDRFIAEWGKMVQRVTKK